MIRLLTIHCSYRDRIVSYRWILIRTSNLSRGLIVGRGSVFRIVGIAEHGIEYQIDNLHKAKSDEIRYSDHAVDNIPE